MDGEDILFMIVAGITISVIGFCGGLTMGVYLGMENGYECILAGHKIIYV